MKVRLLFLFGFVCGNFSLIFAQQGRIDTLESKLDYQGIVNFIDSLKTEDEDLLYQKAEAFRKMGNISDAINCLQSLCNTSKNIEVFRQLANYYNKIDDQKQALETLQKALQIEKSERLYYEIAKLQYNLRLYDEGAKTCDEILRNDTIANVLRLQSTFYQALEKTDEAKRLLRRGIARNAKDYRSVIALTNILKKEADYEGIIPITEAYLQQDSTNVKVLSVNAYAYFSLHKYRKAKVLYEKLFELGYAPANQYFYLGYVYYRLGDANDAYNNLLIANQLAQELNEGVLYYLGLAAIKSLRYEEGIKFLEKSLKYYLPDKEQIREIYVKQSSAYNSLGKHRKAIEMLRKAQKYRYTYRTLFNIAYLYEKNKEEKRAIIEYQKFLKALPDSLGNERLKSLKIIATSHLKRLKEEEFMKGNPSKKKK